MLSPVHWRFVHSPPGNGPVNMAVDHALMRRVRRTGEAVARVYSWSAPVLSFGRNQRTAGAFDERRIHDAGVGVVRRPTGGRSLLHCREITYSVVRPLATDVRQSTIYADINESLVKVLRGFGIRASIAAPEGRSAPLSLQPCFAEPSAGELVVGNRKLAGSAQWTDDGVLLQHGSILTHDDQPLISTLTRQPVAAAPAPATIAGELGHEISIADFASAFFGTITSGSDAGLGISHEELLSNATDLATHYASPEWTWRR